MVSEHVYYQLILFALLWLVVIVHLTRPKCLVTAPAMPTEEPEPRKPKHHRSNEPQPNSVRLNFCMAVALSDTSGQYERSLPFPWPSH